jgi:hypothetical protein
VINPPGFDFEVAAGTAVYWVSDTDGIWGDAANWSLTTGGAGGAGVPSKTSAVTFDGEGTGKCTVGRAVQCAALSFTESAAQVDESIDQNGQAITCSTFTYNCTNNTDPIFDGAIILTGATFTITAAVSAAPFASAHITSTENCTYVSAVALPWVTAQKNFTTSAALTVARLNVFGAATTMVLKESANFTLTAYVSGDWDSMASIASGSGSTAAGFVNPAGMVVSDIAAIKDNCDQVSGNTRVSTALFWVGDSAGEWTDLDVWSLTTNGTAVAKFPNSQNNVEFDGGGTAGCTLTANAACRQLLFDDSVSQTEVAFITDGFDISVDTFLMDWDTGDDIVFDGEIEVRGASFVVTAATAATFFASATIVCLADVTITSTDDTNLPHIQAAADVTFTTAITVARLELTAGDAVTQALEFLNGVDFTLTAYTVGDWDGTATAGTTIVSDDATTWGFVNPSSMVVAYINVQDSNATNAIDATDNCTDGTGNTNWTFS